MNRSHVIAFLGCGIAFAAILWRLTPPHAAPIDTAADLAAGTMGQPTPTPTLDAAYVVGMSYGPDDGVAGPVWYSAQYPGTRLPMPPMVSPVRLS